MAQAGYCAACGENVWLTPEGTCSHGHGADCISGAYEAGAPPGAQPVQPVQTPPSAGGLPTAPLPLATQQPDSDRKRRTGIIVAAVIIGTLLTCCLAGSLLAAITIPVFNASRSLAEKRACFANERTVEGAAQMYAAENDGAMPDAVDALVDADYMKRVPECPSGGTYDWDPEGGTYTCSVHGHY